MLASASLVLLALAPVPPAPEAWRMDRLDLVLTVDPERESLLVEGTMVVQAAIDGGADLTLAVNARKPALRFQHATAAGVKARVALLKGGPTEQATFHLPRPVAKGGRVTVAFALRSGAESSQFQMGRDAFYASWVEAWYPTLADAAGEPGAPEVAGSTTFRLPRGWRSVSNGALVETRPEGGRTVERWRVDAALARSFVAAPFLPAKAVEAGGRPIAFHLLKARATSDRQAEALAGALRAMEARFGPYPYAAYHVAEVPEGASFAAGSEQGFIMVRSSILDDVRGTIPLFAHEAAHGWWGNLVHSKGPGAKMLSEALAQYGAVMSIEALEGRAAMDEFLRFSRPGYNPIQCALGFFHIWREGGDNPLAALEDAKWDHNLADSKGMWFYHMLRGRLGDDAFFRVLRAVIDESAGQEIDLDGFRARLRAVDPSIEPFLATWLDRKGAPVLRTDWWTVDRGAGVEIAIEQAGEPFAVPLDVAITTANGETVRQTLALTERSQRFTVAVPARGLDVRLDPDNRLLMWRPEFGERPEVP
jgi:aminopeptidase N